MDAIAREAGTFKVSLYARFTSKEQLFSYVLEWALRSDWPTYELGPVELDDLERALNTIAHEAVRRALDPSVVQLGRLAVAHASRLPDMAQMHAGAVWPRRGLVIDLLNRHASSGAIVADDPEVLAEHFFGMVAGEPARLASLGIVRDPADQERHTQLAVQLFLRSLRPN
jgi:AcrR family transcriptional regulator